VIVGEDVSIRTVDDARAHALVLFLPEELATTTPFTRTFTTLVETLAATTSAGLMISVVPVSKV
jgi:hypothetical protein